jgi:hypothetical protein
MQEEAIGFSEELDSAGSSWRSAVRQGDEAQTHKLGLGGNVRISARGLLNAVLKVTNVVVTVKQQILAPGFDLLKLLKLPADVFSAGIAILGALHQTMPPVPYFVAVVLSRSEQGVSREVLLEQVAQLASQVADGDNELPFYFFITKKVALQVQKELKADGLKSACEWLSTNQFLDEQSGTVTLRERHFEWGFSAAGV